ncbi:YkvI family membrane protein [Natronincola ferrireducens]|uniref:Uncharacterized membrane protein YkvI n=1 Tax=Natronincola ferrireducens TaxID=393762 RepID=A0A1G9HQ98_9FIRM|nr:hypothetical protein [Natronincola ferrireducens]SDL15032.1 Uncharacterized membrane protein YkvI [Natronincola ferrireducens]
MTRRKSIATLVSIYIGTVIGAGFASGQEIIQFFGKYGVLGVLGVVFSTILLTFIATNTLKKVYKKKFHSFEEFGIYHFNKKIFPWINGILALLLLVGYFVMLAGSGAIANEHFGLPSIYGIVGMSFMSFAVLIFGVRGVAEANKVIVPVLMVVVFYVSFCIIKNNRLLLSNAYTETILTFYNNDLYMIAKGGWLWSAFVYAGHNSIGATVVMTSLLPFIYDEKAARYGGTIGALGLGLMALLILVSLLILYTDVMGLEVPMVAAAHSLGEFHKQVYSIILLLAMFTTAIANGYGCVLRFSFITGIKERWVTIFVCLFSIPLALMGFKNLVAFFYPLFGYLGFLFIGRILLKR